MAAVTRLGIMMNQPIEATQLQGWRNRLETFSTGDLIYAFTRAEATFEAWPTPARVENLILRKLFVEDLTWVLAGLRYHGTDWEDKPEYNGAPTRSSEVKDLWIPGEHKPAIPAPEIPWRICHALQLFGRGLKRDGLVRLEAHPNLKHFEYRTATEEIKAQEKIEAEFYEAWVSGTLNRPEPF